MTNVLVAIVGLVPFFGHQFAGHNLHLRMLRIVRPSILVPQTAHEERHYHKSRRCQHLINTAWGMYLVAVAVYAVSF